METKISTDLKTMSVATLVLTVCLIALFLANVTMAISVTGSVGLGLMVVAAHQRNPKLAGVAGVLLVAFAWLGWAKWGVALTIKHVIAPHDLKDLEALGQLGDLFGGVNALFASFALVGVGVASYFQYRSAQMMESQLVQQSFEPLFFKLLDRAVSPESLTDHFGNPGETKDVACETFLKSESHRFERFDGMRLYSDEYLDWLRTACINFYNKNEIVLAPYFRKLFHLFKFIEKSALSPSQKRDYANIARAALSSNDLLLLAMNLQTLEGKHFIPLIEHYGLFKHSTDPTCTLLGRMEVGQSAFLSSTQREKYWHIFPRQQQRLRLAMDAL